ncbi:MAG TPA: c-type cytochrome [Vicinamibacteria bacterium]|nr:c-type cytochrome [Vicinamibacteria bacterium]
MRRTALLLVAAWLGLAGCRRPGRPAASDPLGDVFRRQAQEEGLSRVETDGKRLFVHYCATCHGERGQGDGQNAYNLDPKPPDFQQSLRARPPSYWRQIVEGGSAAVGRSPLCPPRGRSLSVHEVDAVVAYLEVLGPRAASPPPGGAPPAEGAPQ